MLPATSPPTTRSFTPTPAVLGNRQRDPVTVAHLQRNIALAIVEAPHFQVGSTVWAEIYLNRELVWERRSRAQTRGRAAAPCDTAGGVLVEPALVNAAPKSPDGPWLGPDAKPQIVIESINKTFGAFWPRRQLRTGDVRLVGASGCGKTTLLRAGWFCVLSSGRILIEDADTGAPHEPRSHDVPVLALFPHYSRGQRHMDCGAWIWKRPPSSANLEALESGWRTRAQAPPIVRRPETAGRVGAR
jgi:hypothetical protein